MVSSDFTHFGAAYGYAPFKINKNVRKNIEKLDYGAIDKILDCDLDGFLDYLNNSGVTICGKKPIGLLLKILPDGVRGEVVHYYLSGDKDKNYNLSVSYASIIFTK